MVDQSFSYFKYPTFWRDDAGHLSCGTVCNRYYFWYGCMVTAGFSLYFLLYCGLGSDAAKRLGDCACFSKTARGYGQCFARLVDVFGRYFWRFIIKLISSQSSVKNRYCTLCLDEFGRVFNLADRP